ncbi:T9SS type A sorting domain-containing protein [Hymenobacter gummosus]|uniref:T9SS type A sorting domain-containing protein n=1 Tax=Hymenobacter gummosus TaxID=1776032 RepID=A0A3S0H509_9BACT|nr:family 43 glycosylhydrolase [Hymenobacter gummosus]RTQ48147.1 T9SS type A sorting domain-containing protein [Hymenobacter gummosus]
MTLRLLLRRPAAYRRRLGLLLLFLLGWLGTPAYALQGLIGVHDPSTIVKEGNKYWVFATGQGIYGLYSTDLVNWTPAPRPVFVNNAYPGWINGKVPGFQGNFWAPECIYQNGRYYLYYSCSTFGSKVSAIGLVTNVTLDPTSPNYQWVDQGEVVSSNASSAANAIDPAIFRDTNNDLWLTYGSFFGGLRMMQLNASTGKPLGTQAYAVASGDVEAACLYRRGGYYYLFINRGACCQGSNSTYRIQVGRSTSVTGPFLDQSGMDLNAGGGTPLISGSGRFAGPGHPGIFEEGGVSYFSHHYYDTYDNGAPKLGLAKLTWDAASWPMVSRDWVTGGRYEIKNQLSNLIWDAWGCTGVAGQAVAQGTPAGLTCQRWDVAPLGDGLYKITNAQGGLAVSVVNCAANGGALLHLATYAQQPCQQFYIDRANDGTLVLASANGNRVVEVPNASQTPGQQLGLWDYNGCQCQRWTLLPTGVTAARNAANALAATLYPVPAPSTGFTIDLGAAGPATQVEVFDARGRRVHQQTAEAGKRQLTVRAALQPGIYLVHLRRGAATLTQKLVVQ